MHLNYRPVDYVKHVTVWQTKQPCPSLSLEQTYIPSLWYASPHEFQSEMVHWLYVNTCRVSCWKPFDMVLILFKANPTFISVCISIWWIFVCAYTLYDWLIKLSGYQQLKQIYFNNLFILWNLCLLLLMKMNQWKGANLI